MGTYEEKRQPSRTWLDGQFPATSGECSATPKCLPFELTLTGDFPRHPAATFRTRWSGFRVVDVVVRLPVPSRPNQIRKRFPIDELDSGLPGKLSCLPGELSAGNDEPSRCALGRDHTIQLPRHTDANLQRTPMLTLHQVPLPILGDDEVHSPIQP
jgi:hypothetical protein